MRPGFAPLLGIWLGILGLGVASANAEIYRWTDADGRVHFTQDLSQVPPDQRAGAKEKADAPRGLDPIQTFTATSPSRTHGSNRMKKSHLKSLALNRRPVATQRRYRALATHRQEHWRPLQHSASLMALLLASGSNTPLRSSR